MLIRISLIVAIIAGLAVGVVNFITVKEKITALQADLASTKTDLSNTRNDLSNTRNELEKTKTDLAETKKNLEETTALKDKSVAEATLQSKRATQLADELTKTRKDRDDAQAYLQRYKATGFEPEQILALGKTLKQSQDDLMAVQTENTILNRRVQQLAYEIAKYRGTNNPVPLPATLAGKILVADPKWDFVVLNIGADQGVKQEGELLVSRNGRLVAKVIVRSVEKDRCVANVVAGWKRGDLMEGDLVTPAHPSS
jgi:hypothetical protein